MANQINSTGQDFSKIKQILKRRKWYFIIPFSLTFLACLIVALILPNIYVSKATILIKSREVPPDLVPSIVTSYAEQRIQTITQEVMSRERILGLVKKYNLLPGKREKMTADEIVDKIKSRIHVEPITAEINTGKNYGRPKILTIAFTVSYEDEDPKKAQLVTNEISSFYLEKNLEVVKEHTAETAKFLKEQLDEVKDEIKRLENKIAEYRKKHLEELPEFMNLNMQKLEKLTSDIKDIDMQIRSLKEQKAVLENQLISLNPYAGSKGVILSPEDRLQQARIELAQLLSKYSEKYPLVQAKKKEIALLEKQAKVSNQFYQLNDRLEELKIKLAQLKSRYSDKHPSVIAVKEEIKKLKKEIAKVKAKLGKFKNEIENPTNPAYIQIKSEIDRLNVSIASLKSERARLEKEINEIYKKLHAMPEVAKKYNELQLDYENAKMQYNELKKKYMLAKIDENLQSEELGERFEIIEPAYFPEKPSKPNRLAISLIGLVLGLGAGVGSVSLAEYTDKRIYDIETLEKLTNMQVLSVIPRLYTEEEKKKEKRKKVLIILSFIIAAFLGILAFHYYVMDLYIFWTKLIKHISP